MYQWKWVSTLIPPFSLAASFLLQMTGEMFIHTCHYDITQPYRHYVWYTTIVYSSLILCCSIVITDGRPKRRINDNITAIRRNVSAIPWKKKSLHRKKRNRPADRLWYCTRLLFMSWRRFFESCRYEGGQPACILHWHTHTHHCISHWERAVQHMCVLLWAILIDASNRWWYMVMRLKGEPRPNNYS